MVRVNYAVSYPGRSKPRWVMPEGQYFKFLRHNSYIAPYSEWKWPKPGVWTPYIDRLVPCGSGYHLLRPDDLTPWLSPEWQELWVAQVHPKSNIKPAFDKVVVNQARLLYRVETWTFEAHISVTDMRWRRGSAYIIDHIMSWVTGEQKQTW